MTDQKAYQREYNHRPVVIMRRREWFRKYFKKPELKAYHNEWIGKYHKGRGKVKWNKYMRNYQRKRRALIKMDSLVNKLW